jgi:hypothetical protein
MRLGSQQEFPYSITALESGLDRSDRAEPGRGRTAHSLARISDDSALAMA